MKHTLTILLLVAVFSAQAQKQERIASPDGKLQLTVEVGQTITWQLKSGDATILTPSPISVTLDNGEVWGHNAKLQKAIRQSADEIISAPFYKKAQVTDHYNQMTLTFKGNYGIVFRAYNDGVAYRIKYTGTKPITVVNEEVVYNYGGDKEAIVSYVNPREQNAKNFEQQFFNSFENTYTFAPLSGLDGGKLLVTPGVVALDNGTKVLMTEADLENYPGMYLNSGLNKNAMTGVFATYPKTIVQGGHNMLQGLVTEREPYIAKLDGKFNFPWRVAVVANTDKELANCDMIYRLASPSRVGDIAWIKPGKVAWEWWNYWNLEGVDFEAGINNQTYKYYIDFAAKHGIEYIILDEGWAVNLKADLMQVVPEIDIKELVDYGMDKGVGIILWAGYEAFRKDLENVCRYYSNLGVKGFKVDFMDRDDQPLVKFIYDACATAARYNLLLDLHGMYKPTGLQRTYPNVLNNEGVFGLEQVKWVDGSVDMMKHDVTLPFVRMAAGPMDYTHGAMRNSTRDSYASFYYNPMSQGTRCHQLAMYVVFESPLNMLCDSPTNYMKEAESTDFIANIPVVWDETRMLEGKIGEYVTTARRKGDTWYIGGLTNWTPRETTIDLGFLDGNYTVTLFRDGVNAHRIGTDYKREQFDLGADKKLTVREAPGGGFAIMLKKK